MEAAKSAIMKVIKLIVESGLAAALILTFVPVATLKPGLNTSTVLIAKF
jgi:hypothetical protein